MSIIDDFSSIFTNQSAETGEPSRSLLSKIDVVSNSVVTAEHKNANVLSYVKSNISNIQRFINLSSKHNSQLEGKDAEIVGSIRQDQNEISSDHTHFIQFLRTSAYR